MLKFFPFLSSSGREGLQCGNFLRAGRLPYMRFVFFMPLSTLSLWHSPTWLLVTRDRPQTIGNQFYVDSAICRS